MRARADPIRRLERFATELTMRGERRQDKLRIGRHRRHCNGSVKDGKRVKIGSDCDSMHCDTIEAALTNLRILEKTNPLPLQVIAW